MAELCVFAMEGTRDMGVRIAGHLDVALGEIEVRNFPDGEQASRPVTSVHGKDVFVITSLHADHNAALSVGDKLSHLLMFIGALKDAFAAHVSVLAPYLCYARQDRQTRTADPLSLRYLAQLLESVGTDCVAALDVHNLAAFQNAFRCRCEHIEAKSLLANHFASEYGDDDLAVVSPDIGGIKRAGLFRASLSARLMRPVASAYLDKQRKDDKLCGDTLVGPVDGCTVILLDDLISTGATLLRAAEACHRGGATRVLAAATHGIFAANAGEALNNRAFERIVVTDSVHVDASIRALVPRLQVLDASLLLASTIAKLHHGEETEMPCRL